MNIDKLKEELHVINKQIEFVNKLLGDYKLDYEYKVVTKKSNGVPQYYKSEKEGLKYISKKQINDVKVIFQKEYYDKVYIKLKQQKTTIEKFINNYEQNLLDNIYEKMADGRKALVTPIIASRQDYIKHWNEKYTGGQNGYQINNGIKTNKGEMVRSKSEKILADLFYKYDIPYQYEPAVKLDNGKTVFPDFVLLNIAERKTYYWEHFGLASDDEYTMKNLDKLYYYEKSGIIVGDNLILSIESEHNALDVTLVEKQIKEHLL